MQETNSTTIDTNTKEIEEVPVETNNEISETVSYISILSQYVSVFEKLTDMIKPTEKASSYEISNATKKLMRILQLYKPTYNQIKHIMTEVDANIEMIKKIDENEDHEKPPTMELEKDSVIMNTRIVKTFFKKIANIRMESITKNMVRLTKRQKKRMENVTLH